MLSQTFCDTEMLELERRGISLFIASVHPPLTTMRHAHALRLKAPVLYAPPGSILEVWEQQAKENGNWPAALVEAHERKYGEAFKSELRARNAAYFAQLFTREGIQHFHVHFANRAAHTALFIKQLCGISFSVTAHGQDFMSDLGSEELLQEICAAAEFVAVETDFSRDLLAERCPESAAKIHRVYNGMELENFPPNPAPAYSAEPPKIVSIGRLVGFKGFEFLITACEELRRRANLFTCEIIGDGPLREDLQARIDAAGLSDIVRLTGALPQQSVFDKLRACDIFALPSIVHAGASDVFPTVILEAMASARPVVSTQLAGIPEAVAHGTTGLLVPPGNSAALTDAIERLIRDQWLRVELGNAGRVRVEENFQVETTVEPLLHCFEQLGAFAEGHDDGRGPATQVQAIAYLIDRWPDPNLPTLEAELVEIAKRGVAAAAFVCEFDPEQRVAADKGGVATRFEFLPDAMAIEAEWQADRVLGFALEEDRAAQTHRAPPALFLQQAHYAIALRKWFEDRQVRHVHATSSRALVCAAMLKKLLGVTVSAAIEPEPRVPVRALRAALAECIGGRVSDPGLKKHLGDSWLLESTKLFGAVRLDLRGHAKVWNEWAELLKQWQ